MKSEHFAGVTGTIFNIQRFCVNDGPGIRTTVFVKGCPLRCAWCHNPESQRMEPEYLENQGKKELFGRTITAGEALEEVLRDRLFYETSGGGLTISGGEPLAQPLFTEALLGLAKEAGLHTCAETCGYASEEVLSRIAAVTDLFLWDCKLTDPKKHRQLTGVSDERILANLEILYRMGKEVILRCPIIPDVNDDEKHLAEIAALTQRLSNIREVQVEPYHSYGEHKYEELKREVPAYRVPSEEEAAGWIAKIAGMAVCPVKRA